MSVSAFPLGLAIAKLAARQHGIVDLPDLLAIGLPRSTIGDWVRSGRLHRVHRGVFSVAPPSLLSIEGRWLAAVRACGPGAVLSHASAAQLHWLLDRAERCGIHVSVPGRRVRNVKGVIVHRPRHLPVSDTTIRSRVPVTSPTRTVWDVASSLAPKPAKRCFERARSKDRLDESRLLQLLAADPRHKGAARLRRQLRSAFVPLDEVRSWLEDLLLNVCSEHGLSLPEVNAEVFGYEIDFYWERELFAVEADGGDHIGEQRDKDNARDLATGRAGVLTRRYSSRDMNREHEVAAEVAAVLIERRRILS